MSMHWRLEDLVDLEYFLHMDEARPEEEMARRDRAIFVRDLLPAMEKERVDTRTYRRKLLRLWLEKRRRMEAVAEDKEPLPGTFFAGFNRLIRILCICAGIFTGFGMAAAFLSYRGAEPLNVWTYLGLFVFLQLVLLAVLLMSVFLTRGIGMPRKPAVLLFLIGVLFSRIIHNASGKMTATVHGRMRSAAGLIIGKTRLYGPLFYWPVFIAAQFFGVGFNLGVLSGSLMRVVGSDLAFGWQSTLQWSARTIHGGVKILASPWSWMVPPELAHPTLAQVEGSRMVYKNGMVHLTTTDLVSWWPFLLLAVLCYGLAPRMLLLVTGVMAQRRALARMTFRHTACEELVRRLLTPVLETGGRPLTEANPVPDFHGAGTPASGRSIEAMSKALVPEKSVVLVPEEIAGRCREEELQAVLAGRQGWRVNRMMTLPAEPAAAEKMLMTLAADEFRQVIILQEAWQPPIFESLRFFKEARKILGDKTRMDLVLIGRPSAETILTPSRSMETDIWRGKIAGLADPYLGCYGLRGPHEG